MLIGERTAEQVKIDDRHRLAARQDADHGDQGPRPRRRHPEDGGGDERGDPRGARRADLARSSRRVHLTLEKTPPELAADIVDRGIVLVGGGSLLRDLDVVLRQETKLPILRSDDPFTAVVHGAGKALDDLDLLKQVSFE